MLDIPKVLSEYNTSVPSLTILILTIPTIQIVTINKITNMKDKAS